MGMMSDSTKHGPNVGVALVRARKCALLDSLVTETFRRAKNGLVRFLSCYFWHVPRRQWSDLRRTEKYAYTLAAC